jgi:molybdate transport system substrate-binding protein
MVAVASNFAGAMDRIVVAYELESGAEVRTVYSSTGKLYAQIRMGAPYDIFLAADGKRPELLAEEGLCEAPFVYATGETVLWTKNDSLNGEKSWQAALTASGDAKVAISAPEIAPYGAAAISALTETGAIKEVKDKLVYGQNVAQAFQYAYHGSAGLGFTALSLARSGKGLEGKYWPIPEAPPIIQKGCVVAKKGEKTKAIAAFLKFFRSGSARAVLEDFGYK